ncbi:dihydroorotase [Bartonella sp. DGB2]|uniref:dihydroorotase n=1 Tax=Bartonella sp. DGB2 TaxID=3388426 RepID=UPI00398FF0AB
MKPVLFQNARIIDPCSQIDEIGALLIENGTILAAGRDALHQGAPEGTEIIDINGKTILPGLVDARVFTGEPGEEHRETLVTAAQAAVAGGVTSFILMPDTNPVIDNTALVNFIYTTAQASALVNIYPTAAITRGLAGQEITEFGLLQQAGAIALSEGRHTLASPSLLRRAMTYARDFDLPLMLETQDADLTGQGVMNAGLLASWLGLPGIPREAEVIPLERDLYLALMTNTRYHASQVSTALSVAALARARQKSDKISAAVSIHHLSLNENDINEYRSFFRLTPPLRHEDDRLAMIEAVKNGTVDMIVSSHDPQDVDAKRLPFEEAIAGAIGLETLLSAALRLYHEEHLSLLQLSNLLSYAPAKKFGLNKGTLQQGADADFIIVDLEDPWILKLDQLRSRAKNSCFENARFLGRVHETWVAGNRVFFHESEVL